MRRPLSLCPLLLLLAQCHDDEAPLPDEVTYTEERTRCADRNPLRNLYFGDLHFHSRHSWDAYGYQLEVTPDQAYAFARGAGPVLLPPVGADGRGQREVRLERPLDFAALTDHAEFFGELHTCRTPGLTGHDSAACADFRQLGEDEVSRWGMMLVDPERGAREATICGADGAACRDAASTVWAELRGAAETAYDRSAACTFTTLVGYEYTATPLVSNLHRNVIFRNAVVPDLPVSYFEEPHPPGLWTELARQCLDGGTGCDALVIPHNSNWSNGTLFSTGRLGEGDKDPRQVAALRARLEPLVEIMQHKGDMECTPGLGADWPADPRCAFEKIRVPPFDDCGDETGWGGVRDMGCVSRLDFLRGILLQGLLDETRLGGNVYQLGVIGSTDSHSGTPGNTGERAWPGHVGNADDTPEERLGDGNLTHRGLVNNPGGLAAVWALERSRDAIFEALRRRETYATSGTRIAVRLFAGWRYDAGLCDAADRVEEGYRRGVPMGGLLERGTAEGPPRLLVEASADPQTGTPLQVVQIIKGWIGADGMPRERVFDVAGDGGTAGEVDESCAPRGSGSSRLCALWSDPEFDPAVRAFYYARVLEQPTCRWSTWLCQGLDPGSRPAGCSEPKVPRTIQERAITSPIWYVP